MVIGGSAAVTGGTPLYFYSKDFFLYVNGVYYSYPDLVGRNCPPEIDMKISSIASTNNSAV